MAEIKDITLRKINSEFGFDFTRVIEKKIDTIARIKDKEIMCDLVKTYAEQDVEIIKTIVESEDKRFEKVQDDIEERIIANERELQFKRLFGFEKKANIHEEARQLAIRNSQEYLSSISVTNNPVIQSIIAQRMDTVQKLKKQFSKMIEEDNTAEKLELDNVLKVIPH